MKQHYRTRRHYSMGRLFRKIGILLTLIIISVAWASHAQGSQGSLYLFYNDKNVGEKNQVLGIARFLKQSFPDMTETTVKLEDQETLLSDVRENFQEGSGNKGILVTAGNDGIALLEHLGAQPNMVLAHSSHQWTEDHNRLKGVADIVSLPRHDITPENLGSLESPYTRVIQTAGVAHNLSVADIQKAYHEQKGTLPNASKYLGIILGGDAETPDKKMLYYTPEEAKDIAGYIALQIREENPQPHLLILNGPRTGKHHPLTGKVIETRHRDGNKDGVTRVFIETLKAQGLTEGNDFTLLDFQFGKPSAYPVVLGALQATKSPVFVAGESTSMVSETADCLPGLVTVYTHSAMNGNHQNHCESEYAAGRVSILENHGGIWKLRESVANNPSQDNRPAAQIIVEAIAGRFREKQKQPPVQ